MGDPASQRSLLVIANSVGLPLKTTGRSYLDGLAERLGEGWALRRWVGTGLHVGDVADTLEARLAEEGEPDEVILQLGIVESCPRPMSESEREWIGNHRSRILRGLVILTCHHFRAPIIRLRKLHQRVDITTWRAKLTRILNRFADRPVKLLGIFPTWRKNDRQSPGYQRQIEAYNVVLAELAAERRCGMTDRWALRSAHVN